jgi:hypothetical protein
VLHRASYLEVVVVIARVGVDGARHCSRGALKLLLGGSLGRALGVAVLLLGDQIEPVELILVVGQRQVEPERSRGGT